MASPRESLTRRHGTGGRATRAAEGRPKEHRMSAPSKQEIRKVVLASLLGATIEWYDFFLYGVVAGIVFNKLFFPTTDPFIGTILAYSTFAIGYLARPLGGFVFGHFGDKLGRKSMLVLTMLIMGLATIGIGRPTPRSALPRRSSSRPCASARASGSAANGAARCS